MEMRGRVDGQFLEVESSIPGEPMHEVCVCPALQAGVFGLKI